MAVGYLSFELVQNAPLFIPGSSEGQWISMNFLPSRLLNTAFERAGMLDFASDGSVTVLSAYPALNGKRALPVPLSWNARDIESGEADDRSGMTEYEISYHDMSAYSKVAAIALDEGGPMDLPESVNGQGMIGGMFFLIEDDEIMNFNAPLMQVTPDMEKDLRPVVCLSSGNSFKGLIRIEASSREGVDAIATELRARKAEIFIGRRRQAGFGGRLTIEWDSDILDSEGAFFSDSELKDVKKGQVVRLVFLSRVVSPEDRGLEDMVSDAFGKDFQTIGVFTGQVRERGLAGQGHVWKEGSVVVMGANTDVALETMRDAQNNGLGLLTDKGYGRFMALKKAEEGIEYGYWLPQAGAQKVDMDVDSVSKLRDRVVDTMVENAAKIYAEPVLNAGFGGEIPDAELLIQAHEALNKGLAAFMEYMDGLVPGKYQALMVVKPGNGACFPEFMTDLYKGRMNTGIGRDLDLDALYARKTPMGVRIGKLSGKRKKELLDKITNRIAVIVMKGLVQKALSGQVEA